MRPKILVTDPQRCTGCGLCEIACSLRQTGMSSPARARIRIVTWAADRFVPVTCQQCEDAPCVAVCPQEALAHDHEFKRVKVDYARCISCRMCVAACPYGAIAFEADTGRVFKCDQCDGEPECVKWCEPGALAYIDTVSDTLQRLRTAAGRMAIIKKG